MLEEMGFILNVFILNCFVLLKALRLSDPLKFWINAHFFYQLSYKKDKVKEGHSEEGC